ncbi:MAG: hypothetical protein IJX18_01540 [Clostridia bacterium]|nr:hypothetical protein [Clostridia bacterium]
MSNFKKRLKTVWTWIWECLKRSFISFIMYITLSFVLFMFTNQDQTWADGMTTSRLWWCIGVVVAAVAYNAFTAFVEGGNGYDMLVAGNMKRMTSKEGMLKMSSHKVHKEYRAWKGFAIGGLVCLITVITGLIWGANQQAIDQVLLTDQDTAVSMVVRVLLFIGMFAWGWATLPFIFINAGGTYVSYYLIMLFGLLPVVISGIFYIVGAYARRRKKLNLQEAEARAAEEAEKVKSQKINYGGLPGTKPNKKK